MVPDISRGNRTIGLLAYLYGPGRRDEHTDPHIVASWEDFVPDPGRHPEATVRHLADALDLRVRQRERAGRGLAKDYVWHCPVRTAPGDRILTDQEWATVARRILNAVGLAKDGDPHGCRWIAVRHAEDHIHIVATRVRADLTLGSIHRDFPKAQAECRKIEREFRLRELNGGDGTAAQRPTSAEQFKAKRSRARLTPRERLRDTARLAAAGSMHEDEFFVRLRRAGVRVKKRIAPSGDVTGYALALIGDRNRRNDPIWFSGSTLAPDLSLPKLRARFAGANSGANDAPGPVGNNSRAARARYNAADRLETATERLLAPVGSAPAQHVAGAAAQVAGIGEVIDALADTEPLPRARSQLKAAARTYERAARSQIRAAYTEQRALRRAARELLTAGPTRPEDGGAVGTALSTLVVAVIIAGRWHAARGHAQQAAAAQETADQLWAAYRDSAPVSMLHAVARTISVPDRRRYLATINATLPKPARPHSSASGQELLIATLAEAEQRGHAPAALLQQVVGQRELHSAADLAHVVAWRVRRIADLPAPAAPPKRRKATSAAVSSLGLSGERRKHSRA